MLRKLAVCILALLLTDALIGCFLLINRSLPRLAMWKIIESGRREDFSWGPKDKPDYFYFEPDTDRLSIFRNEILPVVEDKGDDLQKALTVANHIGTLVSRGRGYTGEVRWDSPAGILKQVKMGRGGNCFHYSIIYSTYLSSINIKSRLWALEGDDELERVSHTITEVYLENLKKWVLIDAFWGIYFAQEGYPLSVLELRDSLLRGSAKKILTRSISNRNSESSKEILNSYSRFLKCVFLRTGNDFVNKYNARIRYGVLSGFQKPLDRLPSAWRRGLSYLFGRQDFLIHYVDGFSKSLRPKIIIARIIFYFFAISSLFIFGIFVIALVAIILRKSPLAISLSKKETRQR